MQVWRWLRRNKKSLSLFIFGIFIGLAVVYLGDISVTSKDMLRSLIQADATLLGFLGIIVSYILVSYDTRLDRLEQQRFDCEMANNYKAAVSYQSKIAAIRKIKKDAGEALAFIVVFSIASLLFLIIALGTVDTNLALSIFSSEIGLTLFFVTIISLVLVFTLMSKIPEI